MSDRELREMDGEIHTRLFGEGVRWVKTHFGKDAPMVLQVTATGAEVPRYSTDMNAAWCVWERLPGGSKRLHWTGSRDYVAILSRDAWYGRGSMGQAGDGVVEYAQTAPLAICRAAVAAFKQAEGVA